MASLHLPYNLTFITILTPEGASRTLLKLPLNEKKYHRPIALLITAYILLTIKYTFFKVKA
jgi:hypothetical protein